MSRDFFGWLFPDTGSEQGFFWLAVPGHRFGGDNICVLVSGLRILGCVLSRFRINVDHVSGL
jgi:hypothetical protein